MSAEIHMAHQQQGAVWSDLYPSGAWRSIVSGLQTLWSTMQMLCVSTDKCCCFCLWYHVWSPQLARPEHEQGWAARHHNDPRPCAVARTQTWGSEWFRHCPGHLAALSPHVLYPAILVFPGFLIPSIDNSVVFRTIKSQCTYLIYALKSPRVEF